MAGRDAGGWEVRKLKYVAYVEMGQSPESAFITKMGMEFHFFKAMQILRKFILNRKCGQQRAINTLRKMIF